MQTIPTLTAKAPVGIRRVPPNGLAPVGNGDPAAAVVATGGGDEGVGAPVLVDGAGLGAERVVAVVDLDGAALEGEAAVAVDVVAGHVARAVEPVVGAAGRHGRVEVAGPVAVAFVAEEPARAVHRGVGEVVFRVGLAGGVDGAAAVYFEGDGRVPWCFYGGGG